MTGIGKYSREWLVTNGTDKQKSAMKNADFSRLVLKDGTKAENVKLKQEFYLGTKAEVLERFQQAKAENKYGNERVVANVSGGIENFFDILDENGDGTVTRYEIQNFAAIDTEDFADKQDGVLSVRDLQQMFDNMAEAEGAEYVKNGNRDEYHYQDGTITSVITDRAGNVKEKHSAIVEDGELHEVRYNYNDKSRVETIKDADGRVRYEDIDAQGRVNDKTITTTYDEQGRKKTVKTETSGRTIKEEYNWETRKKTTRTTLKYNTDGVIGDTKQKTIGDCWILSGVNALRDNPKGAKAIKDAIKKNADGSVTVTLKGVDKSYTFTPEEIGAHDYTSLDKEYSSGDVDMNLIEMAITRYRKEIVPEDPAQRKGKLVQASPDDPIKGGLLEEAIQYLTGVTSKSASSEKDIEKLMKKKSENNDRYVTMVQFKNDNPNNKDIVDKHAYEVKRITEDTVYVVNPWDSSKEIAYPMAEFKANVQRMTQADFK